MVTIADRFFMVVVSGLRIRLDRISCDQPTHTYSKQQNEEA
jgi:hypothetical protein